MTVVEDTLNSIQCICSILRVFVRRLPPSVSGGQRRLGRGVVVVRSGLRGGVEGPPAAPATRALPHPLPAVLPAPSDRLLAAASRRHPPQAAR